MYTIKKKVSDLFSFMTGFCKTLMMPVHLIAVYSKTTLIYAAHADLTF